MKKKIIMMVSLLAIFVVTLTGTVAYLTDTDSAVNVMVVGNVDIEQHEYERVVDENGNYVKVSDEEYKLQEFSQAKPALPAYYGAGLDWDEFYQPWGQVGAPGSNDLFAPHIANVIDKFVFVENTGKNDVYYRTIIAIEAPEGLDDDKMIHTSFNANSRFDYNDDVDGSQNASNSDKFYTEIDGVRYLVYTATYTDVLTPGEVSRPSLLQVFLDPEVTNEQIALFGDTWEILTYTQAVQADMGAADAHEALNAAFGEISATSNPWVEKSNIAYVKTVDELVAAVNNGKTTIFLADGEYDLDRLAGKNFSLYGSKNAVITVKGTGAGEGNGQLDYGLDSSVVNFNGVTIKTNNQTYAGYARMSGTYNDVTFENCYCLNQDSVFNNCTFNVAGNQYNVWTWGAPNATFNNCTFNSDGKALLLYGTADTKLTVNGCTFNDNGGLTDLKAAIEIGNDYNKSYELIVNNTVVNGYAVNDTGISTGTTLWANKNSMPQDKLNVVVDGVDVY